MGGMHMYPMDYRIVPDKVSAANDDRHRHVQRQQAANDLISIDASEHSSSELSDGSGTNQRRRVKRARKGPRVRRPITTGWTRQRQNQRHILESRTNVLDFP